MTSLRLVLICCLLLPFCVHSVSAAAVQCQMTLPRGVSIKDEQQWYAEAKILGISQISVYADWSRIQPKAGQWNFTWLDALISRATHAGLQVTLVFGPSPEWAVSYLDHPTTEELARAHPDLPAFSAYVTAVTTRYRTRVHNYQVWQRPTVTTLLAGTSDVYTLFRTATRAVHRVDATLRVIVPEPGDVDICWIAGYLAAAQGTDAPDAVQISPVRAITRPEGFWWRVPALRKYVLSTQRNMELCVDIPFSSTTVDMVFTVAAAALLDGISSVTFSPAHLDDLQQMRARAGIKAYANLRGYQYSGWTLIAEDTPAGVFRNTQNMYALALPLADGRVTMKTSKIPLIDAVAVPGNSVSILPIGDTEQHLAVSGTRDIMVTRAPVLFSGITLKAMEGTPDVLLSTACGTEATLDLMDTDPAGVHLVPDLPGGRYLQQEWNGRTVISTVLGRAPWVHVDVPDGFMFYNAAHIPIEIIVEVMGAAAAEHGGFNIYYDAQGEMRYSRWQWIDVGTDQIFTYTFRLDDALFANRAGYDFRINMGGSKENVRITSIRVRKLQDHNN